MVAAARRDTRMQVAEYRDWVAAQPDEERWELLDGVPVLMAQAKGPHQRIVTNLIKRLDDLAERRSCGAYPGLAILSEAMDDFAPIPDVVLPCGPPPEDGDTEDPILIAEVLSPSTMVDDRGRKTAFYQTVPSLRILLIVYQDERRVEIWRRESEWRMRVAGPEDVIDLPELDDSLALPDIYARLAF